MPFADQFIQGFTQGQQARMSKADLEKRQREEQNAIEDRGIEKDILQHRLRELKIGEKLQAREAARQNFGFMEGQPESQLNQIAEPGAKPGPDSFTAMTEAGLPALMNRPKMTIPGIEELGVGDVSAQPKSMEEQLAAYMAQKQIDNNTKSWDATIPEGGTLVRGTGSHVDTEIKGNPKLVPFVTRGKDGVEKTEWITEEDRAKRAPATKAPLPSRASTVVIGGTDLQDNIDGIIQGLLPADSIPNTANGLKIKAGLKRAGFDYTKANADLRALRSHYQNLNGPAFDALRAAADSTESALTALEDLSTKWEATVGGSFNGARITLAKTGGLGAEAKQLAQDMEAAVGEVQTGLASIKSGGSAASNKALDAAEKQIAVDFAGGKLKTAAASIRREAQHRIAAIRNLKPILPSEAGGGGGTVTVVNPQGVEGVIPVDQLEDALAQGYRKK